ncbi:MAG: hypothetical protein ABFD98_00460 [Syntrophobacteraceae bacterium]
MLPRMIAIWILVVVPAFLSGCSTVSKRNAAVETNIAIANLGLDEFEVKSQVFYSEIRPLISDIKALYGRPGWMEMESVILENPVLREVEEKIPELPEMKEWSRRWTAPWEELYSDYVGLVDRCSIVEAKRMSLKESLLVLEAKYVQATSMELNSEGGTYKSAKAIYGVVETLEKYEMDLDSYAIGPIGLYEVIR